MVPSLWGCSPALLMWTGNLPSASLDQWSLWSSNTYLDHSLLSRASDLMPFPAFLYRMQMEAPISSPAPVCPVSFDNKLVLLLWNVAVGPRCVLGEVNHLLLIDAGCKPPGCFLQPALFISEGQQPWPWLGDCHRPLQSVSLWLEARLFGRLCKCVYFSSTVVLFLHI